jgi:hypothetical protein
MGGLAILLIVVAYIAAAMWVAFRVKGVWRKSAVVLIALLLPTLDGFLGRRYVEHLCARDGGLTVFRVVDNVDGVLGLAPDAPTLKRTGFRFIEIDRAAGDPSRAYRRIERLADGAVVESFDAVPRAKYGYRLRSVTRRALTFIYGYQDSEVIDLTSNEVLSRYRQFDGGFGWASRFLGSFADAGGPAAELCPPLEVRPGPEQLVASTLRSSRQ